MKRMVTDNDIEKVIKDVVINNEIIEGDTGISVEPNSAGDALRVGIDLTGGRPGYVLCITADGKGVEWKAIK